MRVGGNIRKCLEIVHLFGPCGSGFVSQESGVDPANAGKYVRRAVLMGLMVEHKPEGLQTRANFATFTVVEGWEEKLNRPNGGRPKGVKNAPVKSHPRIVINSVFALGQL